MVMIKDLRNMLPQTNFLIARNRGFAKHFVQNVYFLPNFLKTSLQHHFLQINIIHVYPMRLRYAIIDQ